MRWQISAGYCVENHFKLHLVLCKGIWCKIFLSGGKRYPCVPRCLEIKGTTPVSLCYWDSWPHKITQWSIFLVIFMCSQGSKASYFWLLLDVSHLQEIFYQWLSKLWEAVSEGSSASFWKENAHWHSTRQCFPHGRLMQWGEFWWELLCHEMCLARHRGLGSSDGVAEAAPHPVRVGRQMWGVVPHSAWAMHVTSSLLSQRLCYSRDCFQIISSKFPPWNNRNLI